MFTESWVDFSQRSFRLIYFGRKAFLMFFKTSKRSSVPMTLLKVGPNFISTRSKINGTSQNPEVFGRLVKAKWRVKQSNANRQHLKSRQLVSSRGGRLAGVKFSDCDSALVPKFFNPHPSPKFFLIWKSKSCSDSDYHQCNRSSAMFWSQKITTYWFSALLPSLSWKGLRVMRQRCADCHILRSRSSPDLLKLSPSKSNHGPKFFSNEKSKS